MVGQLVDNPCCRHTRFLGGFRDICGSRMETQSGITAFPSAPLGRPHYKTGPRASRESLAVKPPFGPCGSCQDPVRRAVSQISACSMSSPRRVSRAFLVFDPRHRLRVKTGLYLCWEYSLALPVAGLKFPFTTHQIHVRPGPHSRSMHNAARAHLEARVLLRCSTTPSYLHCHVRTVPAPCEIPDGSCRGPLFCTGIQGPAIRCFS